MSKITKKLPKYEQAQIKVALSNSVLSAEASINQYQSQHSLQNQNQTQTQSYYSTSPASSGQASMSSDYSSLGNNLRCDSLERV